MDRERASLRLCIVLASITLGACGDDESSATIDSIERDAADTDVDATVDAGEPATGDAGGDAGADAGPCGDRGFDSTFAAIQKVIFEGRNCTNGMCHGDAKMGGLDLRADAAYESLVETKSSNGSLFRVMPGEPDESFLYNKLRAATDPGSVEIAGSPMPSGAPPLSADHLEAVRRWIEAGAPREGSIGDSVSGQSDSIAALLGSCLPEATPVEIAPLEPPAADEGVQITMAPITLLGESEIEVCWAQYYDVSDVVPAEFQDPERGVFFVNGRRTRQDPNSHHLIIANVGLGAESVGDPSFGAWTCRGGDKAGDACDPVQKDACGSGLCASEPKDSLACIGFGPPDAAGLLMGSKISSAQTAQVYQAPRDGTYEAIPLRGIAYWNAHAFNLTTSDTELNAWINLFYAHDRVHEIKSQSVTDALNAAAGQAPFTKEQHCASWVAPLGLQLYALSSHTHKRGGNFTVDMPDGSRIYQSGIYSDPVVQLFEPPLVFDSSDDAERTLKYCADFNNGVLEDGSPNIDLVTRRSKMPEKTTCKPVACVTGKVGEACSDDDACDSSPGANDGFCDACKITGGQTTENEMFVLMPTFVLPEP